MDTAVKPSDVDLPGYRLHPLKGALKGFWSISISGNWRVVFRFDDGDVYDLDLVDYHQQGIETMVMKAPRTPVSASRRTAWPPSV